MTSLAAPTLVTRPGRRDARQPGRCPLWDGCECVAVHVEDLAATSQAQCSTYVADYSGITPATRLPALGREIWETAGSNTTNIAPRFLWGAAPTSYTHTNVSHSARWRKQHVTWQAALVAEVREGDRQPPHVVGVHRRQVRADPWDSMGSHRRRFPTTRCWRSRSTPTTCEHVHIDAPELHPGCLRRLRLLFMLSVPATATTTAMLRACLSVSEYCAPRRPSTAISDHLSRHRQFAVRITWFLDPQRQPAARSPRHELLPRGRSDGPAEGVGADLWVNRPVVPSGVLSGCGPGRSCSV